jgi:hypothetical protein
MVLGVRELRIWRMLKRPEGRAPFAPRDSTSDFGLNCGNGFQVQSPALFRRRRWCRWQDACPRQNKKAAENFPRLDENL